MSVNETASPPGACGASARHTATVTSGARSPATGAPQQIPSRGGDSTADVSSHCAAGAEAANPVPAASLSGGRRAQRRAAIKAAVEQGGSLVAIARRFGCTAPNIRQMCIRYGWDYARRGVIGRSQEWTPERIERAAQLAAEHGLDVAAERMGVKRDALRMALYRAGYRARTARCVTYVREGLPR